MSDKKIYYLVEIKKNFKYGIAIEAFKIFKEDGFTKWLKDFTSLSDDAELLVNNTSYPVVLDDFTITQIDKPTYKTFKQFSKLSYGILEVFDITNYTTEYLAMDGEKWECNEATEETVNYKFINSMNDVMSNFFPSWEIPDEFLDKLKYIGRRYAVLTLDEDVDPYSDERFSDLTSIDKIMKDDMYEYHIRLKPQQKPFYV